MELIPTSHGNVGHEVLNENGSDTVVLVLPGLGAPNGLRDVLPTTRSVTAFAMPAFSGPTLASGYQPATIADAYDQALERRFAGRRVVVLGVSLGAAVALGMRSSQIAASVLVEPFLTSEKLELQEMARLRFLPYRPDLLPFFRDAIGYGGDSIEYPIAPHPARRTILYGEGDHVPNAGSLPSFVSAAELARLAATGATTISARGRHDLLSSDASAVRNALLEALETCEQDDNAPITASANIRT